MKLILKIILNMRKTLAFLLVLLTLCLIGPSLASATEEQLELKIHNGHFEPENLVVAANAPLKLHVVNAGDAPAEFESFELNRERVVRPGQDVTVFLPSLNPGTYHFFDDFHREVGQGTLLAR